MLVEEKPLGAALHYRAVPRMPKPARTTWPAALAADAGLHLQPGKMMVELRMPGGDKGAALAR